MIHSHEGSLPSPPAGGRGTETCGVVVPNDAAMPGDTGWSPKASGTVELARERLDALPGPGAFWAPRTLVVEPRGAVQRAPVLTGGRLVVCDGSVRLVPP